MACCKAFTYSQAASFTTTRTTFAPARFGVIKFAERQVAPAVPPL
jgi:hypothetical protein